MKFVSFIYKTHWKKCRKAISGNKHSRTPCGLDGIVTYVHCTTRGTVIWHNLVVLLACTAGRDSAVNKLTFMKLASHKRNREYIGAASTRHYCRVASQRFDSAAVPFVFSNLEPAAKSHWCPEVWVQIACQSSCHFHSYRRIEIMHIWLLTPLPISRSQN